MSYQIAIDGPAGAGKSTVAKAAAKELGFIYVDTGAMYRTIALALLRSGTDCANEVALAERLSRIRVEFAYENGTQQMLLNGENVTGLIRTNEVSKMASISSAVPMVREKLMGLQQDIADANNVIMDGRDIGTRILPHAGLKIFLTASVDKRAKRRYDELQEKGQVCDYEQIRADIADRDYRDIHRETAPLKQAEDALYLDTSDLNAQEAAGEIVRLAKERFAL